ncbi:MAG TPA: ankyrin repeat domain-containing protein [Bryobacteraceae bacterium]|nr:ankyrin repeat domain-containing protein [Bryobacteraceae bacterium]
MPVKPLPRDANLEHLKYQAKDLIKAHAARDPQAAQRIREFHPRFSKATDAEIFSSRLRLSDAQLTIARERGFASWTRLKKHLEKPVRAGDTTLPAHERIEDPGFRRAVDLLDAGDLEGLSAHLKAHPEVVRQRVLLEGGNYFRNPALLEFIAENPIRHGKLPPNIIEIAKAILDAGARNDPAAVNETLGLVCSGRVVRECGAQIPLIGLLCEYGADPDSGMGPALPHGEFEAARELIRKGARAGLAVAAALGRVEDVPAWLATAGSEERHLALALAAQFGHAEIARLLLDAGEDPNRYNPVGAHAHSTPLHQAALAGHREVVRLLVERGARLDLKDTIWRATPEGWAAHGGKTEIVEYLHGRTREIPAG